MHIFEKITELSDFLNSQKILKKSIGFVPTMGALHEGHLSLIKKAITENDIIVSSIFVNPTQFNDPNDLLNYPRTLESDIEKLQLSGCHILFVPSVDEMYKKDAIEPVIELGHLENVMEGAHRPGHFKGVTTIVYKLFKAVMPNIAYFGMKDFQQLAVIKRLIKQTSLPVSIVGCEIVREPDGLAMSSRNIRLTPSEREAAPFIFKILSEVRTRLNNYSIDEIKQWVIKSIDSNPKMKVDYFEIVDADSLMPVYEKKLNANLQGCIAVKIGKIRLLDNIALFS